MCAFCSQREGMALLEYQSMPSLRDVAHDGWLLSVCVHLLHILHRLEIPSARSCAAPMRATGTVRKSQAIRPVHHVQKSHLPGHYPPEASQAYWTSPLAFGLIGCSCEISLCRLLG